MKFISRVARAVALTVAAVALVFLGTQAAAAETVFVASASGVVVEQPAFELPVVPVVVVAVIGFGAPYAIAFLNAVLPFVKSPLSRKVAAVVVSLLLGGVGLVGYHVLTPAPWPDDPAAWFGYALLVVVVCQASYALVTRDAGAAAIERATDGGRHASR